MFFSYTNTNITVRQIQTPSIMITASMMMIAGDIIITVMMIIKTNKVMITQHINKVRRNSELERSSDRSKVCV